ncbi:MAG: hypothetical protein FWG83_05100 [Oscillospiraceae bacterium]|nr:hypothetical protein [Oscillospiraceae bacterium]
MSKSKSNSKKKRQSKQSNQAEQRVQKVKLKDNRLAETLSIVIPCVLVLVFLVGGVLLFIHLEEGRRLPDEEYLNAEKLVNDQTLIGLTLEECREAVGIVAMITGEDEWTFITGRRMYSDGQGARFYEIVVKHRDGVAVEAIYRESK